jgi:hypothetical protein
MTSTLAAPTFDARLVRIHPVTVVDGAGEPCDLCDHLDCVNEGQMYYDSLFQGAATIATGSLACLANLYRADADTDARTTVEVQR